MRRRLFGAACGAASGALITYNISATEPHGRDGAAGGVRAKLTSVSGNFRTEDFYVDSGSGAAAPWYVRKRTLHGGRQEGVDEIEVCNGPLTFTVLPTRGMSIGKLNVAGLSDGKKIPLGWTSPVKEAVHPKHIDLQDHSGLGWLTGFNEWLVRCGVAFAGHPGTDGAHLLTLHGRIGNIPASEVEVVVDDAPPHRIRIRGRVDESMFKFCDFELWTEVSTVPGSTELQIRDTLRNRTSYDKEFQLIYHTNFGPPLLEAGSTFLVDPNARVAPFNAAAASELATWQMYKPPTAGYGETVYCVTPSKDRTGASLVALVDSKATRGVALRYDSETLPAFNLWKNTDTLLEGYVTGLEPGTNFAYTRATERQAGRVKMLKPNEEVTFSLDWRFLRTAAEVEATRQEIERFA